MNITIPVTTQSGAVVERVRASYGITNPPRDPATVLAAHDEGVSA